MQAFSGPEAAHAPVVLLEVGEKERRVRRDGIGAARRTRRASRRPPGTPALQMATTGLMPCSLTTVTLSKMACFPPDEPGVERVQPGQLGDFATCSAGTTAPG